MKMKHLEKHNSSFILLVAILVLSSAFAIGNWLPRALAIGEVLLEKSNLFSDVYTFVANDYVEEFQKAMFLPHTDIELFHRSKSLA